MSLTRLLVLCTVFVALAVPTFAQVPGPELAKMSNLAFGWVSMSGVDPTLDAMASFAPTMLGIREAGFTTGGEVATGTFSFGDFDIDSGWESAQTNLGPGVMRAVHYGFQTNTAAVLGIPGVLVQTQGDSIELSYAQRIGTTGLGLSIVPQDSSSLHLSQGGVQVVQGKSKTDYGFRVGAVTPLKGKHQVRVGANYSYQKDGSDVSLHPALTGAAGWTTLSEKFVTRAATVGASGQLSARTTVYGSYQKIFAKGGSLDREDELIWFGVTQKLTDTVNVRANYLDGGLNVGFTWRTPVGMFIAAYTNKALTSAKDILGDGDAIFVGVDLAR